MLPLKNTLLSFLLLIITSSSYGSPAFMDARYHFNFFNPTVTFENYKKLVAKYRKPKPSIDKKITTEAHLDIKLPKINLTTYRPEKWNDPIADSQLRYNLSSNWQAVIAPEIMAKRNGNHFYDYNATAVIGYHHANTSIYLGYRLVDQKYTPNTEPEISDVDMRLFGPMLSIAISF